MFRKTPHSLTITPSKFPASFRVFLTKTPIPYKIMALQDDAQVLDGDKGSEGTSDKRKSLGEVREGLGVLKMLAINTRILKTTATTLRSARMPAITGGLGEKPAKTLSVL